MDKWTVELQLNGPTAITLGDVTIQIIATGDEDARGDVMEISALIKRALAGLGDTEKTVPAITVQ